MAVFGEPASDYRMAGTATKVVALVLTVVGANAREVGM